MDAHHEWLLRVLQEGESAERIPCSFRIDEHARVTEEVGNVVPVQRSDHIHWHAPEPGDVLDGCLQQCTLQKWERG